MSAHAPVISEIDECSSNPCFNGGACNDEVNQYTCTCVAGYAGDRCETGTGFLYPLICDTFNIFSLSS